MLIKFIVGYQVSVLAVQINDVRFERTMDTYNDHNLKPCRKKGAFDLPFSNLHLTKMGALDLGESNDWDDF